MVSPRPERHVTGLRVEGIACDVNSTRRPVDPMGYPEDLTRVINDDQNIPLVFMRIRPFDWKHWKINSRLTEKSMRHKSQGQRVLSWLSPELTRELRGVGDEKR